MIVIVILVTLSSPTGVLHYLSSFPSRMAAESVIALIDQATAEHNSEADLTLNFAIVDQVQADGKACVLLSCSHSRPHCPSSSPAHVSLKAGLRHLATLFS